MMATTDSTICFCRTNSNRDGYKYIAPRKTANVQPEDEDQDHDVVVPVKKKKNAQTAEKNKYRSQSERLPTHLEADEFVLPALIGGTASEVLSDPRYCSMFVPKLETCLPTRFRGYDWKLLYSLAQHGSSLHTLLCNVRDKSPTLILVETTRGEVFGGFVAVPWKQSTSYYGIGESFVFACHPKFERFPWSRRNAMFMLSTDRSIGMGGGYVFFLFLNLGVAFCSSLSFSESNIAISLLTFKSGGFAWFLNSDLSRGSSAQSDTFMNRYVCKVHHGAGSLRLTDPCVRGVQTVDLRERF